MQMCQLKANRSIFIAFSIPCCLTPHFSRWLPRCPELTKIADLIAPNHNCNLKLLVLLQNQPRPPIDVLATRLIDQNKRRVLKDSGNLLGHNDLDHPYLRAYYSTGRTLAVDKQPSIPLTKRTTSRWRAPPILVQRASHLFPTRVRCLLTRLTLDTRVQQQLSKTILRSPSSSCACRRWFQVHKYLSHCHPFREVSKKDFIFILGSLYHFRIYTYEKLWSKTPRDRQTFH